MVVVAIAAGLWSLIEEPPDPSESTTASPDHVEEESEPTLGERYQLPAEPSSVKVTRFEDVKVMPSRELIIEGNTQPFDLRPLPRPQKLLTGKNLWLEGDFPIAKDRVFLNVTSKASEFSPPIKALLVDVQSGTVVGSYDRVFGQHRSFGVAWGREKDPATGQTRRVLIHASDGLAVPVEEYGADEGHRMLLFKAGFGFAVIIQPDDPVSRKGTSHYAVWHDLRSPPPPLTEVLPFVPLPSDPDEDEWFFETPLGLNPYKGPTLLWAERPPETCKRASFWPGEARHRCHQRELPLNAEWSLLEAEFGSPMAIYNHRTGGWMFSISCPSRVSMVPTTILVCEILSGPCFHARDLVSCFGRRRRCFVETENSARVVPASGIATGRSVQRLTLIPVRGPILNGSTS